MRFYDLFRDLLRDLQEIERGERRLSFLLRMMPLTPKAPVWTCGGYSKAVWPQARSPPSSKKNIILD